MFKSEDYNSNDSEHGNLTYIDFIPSLTLRCALGYNNNTKDRGNFSTGGIGCDLKVNFADETYFKNQTDITVFGYLEGMVDNFNPFLKAEAQIKNSQEYFLSTPEKLQKIKVEAGCNVYTSIGESSKLGIGGSIYFEGTGEELFNNFKHGGFKIGVDLSDYLTNSTKEKLKVSLDYWMDWSNGDMGLDFGLTFYLPSFGKGRGNEKITEPTRPYTQRGGSSNNSGGSGFN